MASEMDNESSSSKLQARKTVLVASSCSICLEAISEESCERSIAKLKCGHRFHLDCIGSAFNAKGRMQCPNCRQVEQGQWLYANGCCLNEDLVDDFPMEEDVVSYGGATTLQFMPTPWCPHQGTYAHFSLTLEDFDNFRIGYMDPVGNVRNDSRVHPGGDHICPYLSGRGVSVGQPSVHFEEFLGLHTGHNHRTSRNTNQPTSSHLLQRNSNQNQGSGISNTTSAIYEGFTQSFRGSRQHNMGFSHSFHGGINQVGNAVFGQPMHTYNAHYRNSQTNANRIWQRALGERATQGWNTTENPNEYNTPLAVPAPLPLPLGQTSSMPPLVATNVGMNWVTSTPPQHNQVDPWMSQMYTSRVPLGASSNWWPLVSHGNNNISQRLVVPNVVPNTYQNDGHFFGLFPGPTSSPPRGSFSDQTSEGPYTWVFQ